MGTFMTTTTTTLTDTAKELVAGGKGLLAMDESTKTCNKRFAVLGIPQTVELRRVYRELLVTTPGLGESISGAILYDETIRQSTTSGESFVSVLNQAGIVPGIKVDTGTVEMDGHPAERVTNGLDGLHERLAEYTSLGARFAKWRATFSIGDGRPSRACIEANASSLARYAALCQEMGFVPIVEPEVLMTGSHSIQRCHDVSEEVLYRVFVALNDHDVALDAMLLKPNMALPGLSCPTQESLDEVAKATLHCLMGTVPDDVAGITFLSGGQSPELASARLNAMNLPTSEALPWPLAFSFGRALQQPTLNIWHGDESNVIGAQLELAQRARCNRAARQGEYSEALEPLRTPS